MAKKSKKRVKESVQEPRKSAASKTQVRRAEAEVSSDGGNSIVRNIAIVILVLVGLYLLIGFVSGQDDKEDGDKAAENGTSQVEESDDQAENDDESEVEGSAPEAQSSDTAIDETDAAFNYTIGDGESYTTIARHAVASIGGDLTAAERVAAETKLVTDINAGWLSTGQKVSFDKDTVNAAVDWSKGLTDDQKAAWQPYADLVAW